MKISKEKKLLSYAIAFALFFGAYANCAWAEPTVIEETVTESLPDYADGYEITVSAANGIEASDGANISVGVENTQSVSVTVNNNSSNRGVSASSSTGYSTEVSLTAAGDNTVDGAYYSVYSNAQAEGSSTKVTLSAGENNIFTGSGYGIRAYGDGGSSEVTITAGKDNLFTLSDGVWATTSGEGDSKVTLSAGENNTITNSWSGVYSSASGGSSEITLTAGKDNSLISSGSSHYYGIYSIASSEGASKVTLSAGENNSASGGRYGLYSYGNAGDSEVTLTAGQDNTVTSSNYEGLSSLASSGGNSKVTLSAGGNNTVTSDSDDAIYSNSDSEGSIAEVTLTAGQDNIVYSSNGENAIRSWGRYGASEVTLTAGRDNSVVGPEYGIVSYGNEDGSSKVTLSAGQDNAVSGGNYGVYAQALTEGSAEVTLTAGRNNSLASDLYGVYATVSNVSTVTLSAGESNYVEGGVYGLWNDAWGAGSSEFNLLAGGDNTVSGGTNGIRSDTLNDNSSSKVLLSAEGNNTITGDTAALYSRGRGSGSSSEVTLTAGQDNNVASASGSGVVSLASEEGSSSVTLEAIGNNTITSSGAEGYFGIQSYGSNGSSAVTLSAGDSNIVAGDYGGAASISDEGGSSALMLEALGSNVVTGASGAVYSEASGGSSSLALTAGQDNIVSSDNGNGIASWGETEGSSSVSLEALGNNTVTGYDYGVYSNADGGSSAVALNAGGTNTITATAEGGTAVHAEGDGSTVDITGAAVLEGDNGAAAVSGGKITFNDGLVTTSASTLTASEGGEIYVYDPNGSVSYMGTTSVDDLSTINMTLASGSAWYLTSNSSATSLSNSGHLDMTADGGAFSTLTLDTLSGDGGLISMDIGTNGADAYNNSDIIKTDDFTGTQTVKLVSTSGADVTEDAIGTVFLLTNSGDGTLSVDDIEQTLFYKHYTLDSTQNETGETAWSLTGVANVDPDEKPTTTVSSVMSAASLNYHSWMMQNTKLLQRLGDLRQGANNGDNGAWFRISGSKLELGGQHGFENEYIQYEVGYDKIVAQNSQFTMYGGLAITYADGDSSYNRGDGDNESKAVSLYFTQINKGGSYLDVVFKLGRWENDFKVYDTVGNRITGETESTGISLSAEYGKKFVLGSRGLYIEPQAQLTYGHFDGDNYTLSNGVNVHSEGIESLVGRAGFNLGWDINPRSNVYLKANVLYEFLGDYAIVMTDESNRLPKSGDYSDTWFLYGLGASFKLGKPNSGNFLHFDVERSTGGDLDQEWFYNVGFRFEM